MKSPRRTRFSQGLYSMAIILGFWYILHVAVGSAAIPSPHETLVHFVQALPGKLSIHLLYSLGRVLTAMVVSVVAGSALGIWIGSSQKADRLITPIVYMLYPIPKIAFLPILMIILGLGEEPKVLLIVLIIVFQFTMAARDGIQEIPKELVFSVASLGVGKWDRMIHLIIPAILPKIITTVRISMGAAISVLFFAENFATTYGIGYYIMNQWAMVNYKEMFSGILALSLAGYLLYQLIDGLDRKVCAWVHVGKGSKSKLD
ncbi:ABC transporter permease [Alkalibacter rhizosphaerae]|uniref:ABC transporter permease n=1 Tax=Alkalibacter rhizosphaerae TaxID=2815577 RepID=A0A975AIZ4_9FIRM|nr:ABC transporter permease [Alkalibacter rhizosphaerae]QSX09040.1 ABC transporter permease [Alkalibacter rhizosphaerae]